MKWFLGIVVVLFLGIAVGIPFYLGPNDLRGCDMAPSSEADPKCTPASAIIAVSGGDTSARAKEAIELYKNGWAPLLIFSGAAQDTSGPSNALVMKRLALDAGIDSSAIVIEEFSRTTAENAANTKKFIDSRGITNVILVTSAYHQRRASLEFGARLGEATIRNHPVPTDKDWNSLWWLSPRGWWLAGGELAKISFFYAEAKP